MTKKKINVDAEVRSLANVEDKIFRSILRHEFLQRLVVAGWNDEAFKVACDLTDGIEKDTALTSLVDIFAKGDDIQRAHKAVNMLGPYTHPAQGMLAIARISPTQENICLARAVVSALDLEGDSDVKGIFFAELFEVSEELQDAEEARLVAKHEETCGYPASAAGIYLDLVKAAYREDDFAELARLAEKSGKAAPSTFRDVLEVLVSWPNPESISRIVESIPNAFQRAMAMKALRKARHIKR